jgi:hypothetical protein
MYSGFKQVSLAFEIEVANYEPWIVIRNARQEVSPPWLKGGAPNKVVKLTVFRFLRRVERPIRYYREKSLYLLPYAQTSDECPSSVHRTLTLYHAGGWRRGGHDFRVHLPRFFE